VTAREFNKEMVYWCNVIEVGVMMHVIISISGK
jgi:hypothetical protein